MGWMGLLKAWFAVLCFIKEGSVWGCLCCRCGSLPSSSLQHLLLLPPSHDNQSGQCSCV
jgi:hypothetical protein